MKALVKVRPGPGLELTDVPDPPMGIDDDTMYDCFTVPQTVWVADLGSEIDISGVRLVVRDASAGMYLDSTMLGNLVLSKRTTLREISVRNRTMAASPMVLA